MSALERFIGRLQQKPERERKIILWSTTSAFFAVVVFVYVTTLELRFAGEGDVAWNARYESTSPFSVIAESIQDLTGDLKSLFGVGSSLSLEETPSTSGGVGGTSTPQDTGTTSTTSSPMTSLNSMDTPDDERQGGERDNMVEQQ